MHTDTIHTLFEGVIRQPGIHITAGKSQNAIRQLRHRVKAGREVSLKTKLYFLQKAGIRLDQYQFTARDMISFAKFYQHTSEQARQFGPEYVFEKWKNQNRQPETGNQ